MDAERVADRHFGGFCGIFCGKDEKATDRIAAFRRKQRAREQNAASETLAKLHVSRVVSDYQASAFLARALLHNIVHEFLHLPDDGLLRTTILFL